MTKILFCLALLFSYSLLHAQENTDKQAVERAMLDYVEGFYEGDTLKISRSISTSVVKYGYWKNPQTGVYAGEPMTFRDMMEYALNMKKRNKTAPATAPKLVNVYDMQSHTASGKITAWWGTDYLLLEKLNNKWMVKMVLWQS